MGGSGLCHVTASRPLGMVIFRFPSAADERGAMILEVLEAALFPFFPPLLSFHRIQPLVTAVMTSTFDFLTAVGQVSYLIFYCYFNL